MPTVRRGARAALALVAALHLPGCVAHPMPPAPGRLVATRPAAKAPAGPKRGYTLPVEFPPESPPAAKIGSFSTRIPRPGDLPAMAGRLQRHRVRAGEDLLTISRDMGIGFRALRDANPLIDEWEPRPGTELLVPTRWILPRAEFRGLVINVAELRAFLFPADPSPGAQVSVLTWPIGAGDAEWQTPIERFTVTDKDTNPTWVVPASIYRKMENPRSFVPPGPDNPLGKHRIRLSIESYLLHGTNDPWSVGRLTTHGCVRFYPEDVELLYDLVYPGLPGEFVYQPVKVTEEDGRVWLEVHRDIYRMVPDLHALAASEVARAGFAARVDRGRVRQVVEEEMGLPVDVTLDTRRATAE